MHYPKGARQGSLTPTERAELDEFIRVKPPTCSPSSNHVLARP